MSKVQIQLHVDPNEAVDLAENWTTMVDAMPVVEQFFPEYRAVAADQGAIRSCAERLERIDRVALCSRPPDLEVASPHEFASRNPDCLFLSIGRMTTEGLRESALGGETTHAVTLKAWRGLVRRARADMHKGAVVENPASGATRAAPAHLHTPGAHSLAQEGLPMLATAGWNRFFFEDCAADDGSSLR